MQIPGGTGSRACRSEKALRHLARRSDFFLIVFESISFSALSSCHGEVFLEGKAEGCSSPTHAMNLAATFAVNFLLFLEGTRRKTLKPWLAKSSWPGRQALETKKRLSLCIECPRSERQATATMPSLQVPGIRSVECFLFNAIFLSRSPASVVVVVWKNTLPRGGGGKRKAKCSIPY